MFLPVMLMLPGLHYYQQHWQFLVLHPKQVFRRLHHCSVLIFVPELLVFGSAAFPQVVWWVGHCLTVTAMLQPAREIHHQNYPFSHWFKKVTCIVIFLLFIYTLGMILHKKFKACGSANIIFTICNQIHRQQESPPAGSRKRRTTRGITCPG